MITHCHGRLMHTNHKTFTNCALVWLLLIRSILQSKVAHNKINKCCHQFLVEYYQDIITIKASIPSSSMCSFQGGNGSLSHFRKGSDGSNGKVIHSHLDLNPTFELNPKLNLTKYQSVQSYLKQKHWSIFYNDKTSFLIFLFSFQIKTQPISKTEVEM